MQRAIGVALILIGALGMLSYAGLTIYRSQHRMSHDFLVKGRLALQALEHAHELDGFARTVENDRGYKFFHEAQANRSNNSDERAMTFLQNYATATHYIETFPGDGGFCGPHHCQQLYETCKRESKMFDSGFVPNTSDCRDIAAEDK